ncbi:calcium/sodium antiporter [Alkalilimnicola ehrlichii MLHE-1]|uniref:Na+/Ca+ antiporter, CaCA family n=1 Tax=Alkalilimnicola ehrlichii (strain ATCC BAA-1101 / DSM 17681 / MLHE-1) TaxID=187272 RepID=Q0A6H1_ALKEH|nr:calcium/sodium antiporter [Alkalilimnicola ehrlichii]ABI57566.1 Na+/Ca+ antiporter, CaCA family [Alkalilimnicola ehrlichii MLHE-1]
MLLQIILLGLSFALLAWSADRFVLGASATAALLGLSPLLVGLTIVAFGTSAPELLVSALAALAGSPGLAVGNAIGSNIANMGLILGLTALFAPLLIRGRILQREVPAMALVMLGTWLLMLNGRLDRPEGIALLAGLVALTAWLAWIIRRSNGNGADAALVAPVNGLPEDAPTRLPRALLWLLLGLVVLLISAQTAVWAATGLAERAGVAETVVGLTLVAVGTSLPELATCLAAARRSQGDIAIGNIIGSNIFNLLGVLGLAATLRPVALEPGILSRDYATMAGITLIFFLLSHGLRQRGHVGRAAGAFLVLLWVAWLVWLGLDNLGP